MRVVKGGRQSRGKFHEIVSEEFLIRKEIQPLEVLFLSMSNTICIEHRQIFVNTTDESADALDKRIMSSKY